MLENYDRVRNRVVDDLAGNDKCYGGVDLPEGVREVRRKRSLVGSNGPHRSLSDGSLKRQNGANNGDAAAHKDNQP